MSAADIGSNDPAAHGIDIVKDIMLLAALTSLQARRGGMES